MGKATLVIVACAVVAGYVMSCGQLSYPIDVAIALDHISLAAAECVWRLAGLELLERRRLRRFLGS